MLAKKISREFYHWEGIDSGGIIFLADTYYPKQKAFIYWLPALFRSWNTRSTATAKIAMS